MQTPPDRPFTTRDAIYRALAKLGHTKFEIARSLLARGVRGRPKSTQHCPLAHYLQEELPDVHRIRVGGVAAEYSLRPNGARTEVPLEPEQMAFVSDFDSRSIHADYHDLREEE